MSSREIAGLVESRHADVCRAVERLMAKSVIQGSAPTAYTHEQNGQQYHEYHLCKRDSYVVVAQLSPEFTARLVDRWQELEQQQAGLVAERNAARRNHGPLLERSRQRAGPSGSRLRRRPPPSGRRRGALLARSRPGALASACPEARLGARSGPPPRGARSGRAPPAAVRSAPSRKRPRPSGLPRRPRVGPSVVPRRAGPSAPFSRRDAARAGPRTPRRPKPTAARSGPHRQG